MLLDVKQDGNQVCVSYYNLNGDTRFKMYDLTPDDKFIWHVTDEKDPKADKKIKNWDGRPVKKVKSKYLTKFRLTEYVENLSFSDRELIFGYNFPKTYFIDIEVEVDGEFPEASKAKTPITAICVVTPNKQCIVLATKDLSHETQVKIHDKINAYIKFSGSEYQFIFKHFKSEYDMMFTFLSMVKKFPMITGWNFIRYDWQYIHNRAKKLGIDPAIASPVGTLFGNDNFPSHVGVMDYLNMYEKWDRSVGIKEDMKLDTAARDVLGITKVKYDGSIHEMYLNDYPKYIFYNAIDTIIVQLIHEKIRTMEIALTISHMSQISVFKAASPVAVTESLLCREFLKKGLVMAKDPANDFSKGEQFQGAFVKHPIVGMHKAVAAFDFASLYPSIMRQMNVSPESFLKKVDAKNREKEISDERIVSVTGAVYDSSPSILKGILGDLYSKRKEYKKKSFEYQQKLHDVRHGK